jgi:hypothetical protein
LQHFQLGKYDEILLPLLWSSEWMCQFNESCKNINTHKYNLEGKILPMFFYLLVPLDATLTLTIKATPTCVYPMFLLRPST